MSSTSAMIYFQLNRKNESQISLLVLLTVSFETAEKRFEARVEVFLTRGTVGDAVGELSCTVVMFLELKVSFS